jgi:hypothetical protein
VKIPRLILYGDQKMAAISRRLFVSIAASTAVLSAGGAAHAQDKSAITTPVPNGFTSFGGPLTVQSMSVIPGAASDSLISRTDELHPSPITRQIHFPMNELENQHK